MTRIVSLGLACLLWSTAAQAQMTCLAANTSAVVNSSLVTNPVAMPTAAPANATLWIAIVNRSDETTTISSVAGSVNATGWVVSSPYDNTNASTLRTWYAYKVGATAGTDTVTVTFSGAINSATTAGWCSDASGLAQTFDAAAASVSVNTGGTNYDSNTAAATGAGGILGFVMTLTIQDPALTVDGAGESLLGSAAPTRVQAVFESYASAGSYGIETTVADASAGNIMVAAFKNAGSSTTCTGGFVLFGVGKC